MQKQWVAMTVAALASGLASAQSSVVIGGNIDMGYSQFNQDAKDGATKYTKDVTGFRTNDSANWTSSQITISVTEDLGNGLKAGFFNAIGLNPTTGDSGIDKAYGTDNYAFGRNRNAYIFLSGANWGQFALGYKDTLEGQLNGIGNAGSGNLSNTGRVFNSKILLGSASYTADTALITDTSRANVFEYASPIFSGFQVMGQYGHVETDTEADAGSTKANFWSVAGKYANGPLSVAALYSKQDQDGFAVSGFGATPNLQRDTYGVFANYDFKISRLYFSYANREVDVKSPYYGSVTARDSLEYDAFDIGVKVPFAGKFTFSASYGWGQFDAKEKVGGTAKYDADVKAYQLALTYDFSKRTSITGYYADTSWEGGKAASAVKYDSDLLGFGLRHQF